jgi:hypothetical protein
MPLTIPPFPNLLLRPHRRTHPPHFNLSFPPSNEVTHVGFVPILARRISPPFSSRPPFTDIRRQALHAPAAGAAHPPRRRAAQQHRWWWRWWRKWGQRRRAAPPPPPHRRLPRHTSRTTAPAPSAPVRCNGARAATCSRSLRGRTRACPYRCTRDSTAYPHPRSSTASAKACRWSLAWAPGVPSSTDARRARRGHSVVSNPFSFPQISVGSRRLEWLMRNGSQVFPSLLSVSAFCSIWRHGLTARLIG